MNKKYICTRVEFAQIWKIAAISGTTVTFTNGSYSFDSLTDVRQADFTEKLSTDKNGPITEQKLTISKLSSNSEIPMLNKSGIFRLRLDDGTIFIWGSKDLPVKFVTCDIKTNEYVFNYSRHTKQPEF